MKHTKSAPDATDARIGELIKQARTKMGYAQADLGREIGVTFQLGREIGVTFQQIQKYESGANKIGAATLHKIAKFFEIPVAWFYDELDSPCQTQKIRNCATCRPALNDAFDNQASDANAQ